MALSRCRVSYVDASGLEHAIEVQADSVYEAAALAVREFRRDEFITEPPTTMTELCVEVFSRPKEHRLRLKQLTNWAETAACKGPSEQLKRERVRELLA
jgi:hypothetical protein